MIRAAAALLVASLALMPALGWADGGGSPHHMTAADGSLDTTACAVCHNEDFSLQRSKLETCTVCHAQTIHAGSDEHLRASPAAVKSALGDTPQGSAALPLTDDGHIYCGTCHLFHDPKVTSEDWLPHGWLPAASGLPMGVRQAVSDRWTALAAHFGDKNAVGTFATTGALQMRVPVDGGQLCRRCHGSLR